MYFMIKYIRVTAMIAVLGMAAIRLPIPIDIGSASAQELPRELALFSYPLPPVTEDDGAYVKGPIALIVAELMKGVNLPTRPLSVPVARLLVEVEAGQGIGFPLARNPAREPHFTWIVKLYADAFAFATLAPAPTVNSFDEARRLEAITVNNNSAPYNRLIAAGGFTNLDIANSEFNNALRLYAGITTAWFSVRSGFKPIAEANGLDSSRLGIGAPVHEIDVWLIGPTTLAPAMVDRIRKQFEALRASGEYNRIMAGVF